MNPTQVVNGVTHEVFGISKESHGLVEARLKQLEAFMCHCFLKGATLNLSNFELPDWAAKETAGKAEKNDLEGGMPTASSGSLSSVGSGHGSLSSSNASFPAPETLALVDTSWSIGRTQRKGGSDSTMGGGLGRLSEGGSGDGGGPSGFEAYSVGDIVVHPERGQGTVVFIDDAADASITNPKVHVKFTLDETDNTHKYDAVFLSTGKVRIVKGDEFGYGNDENDDSDEEQDHHLFHLDHLLRSMMTEATKICIPRRDSSYA